MAVDAVLSHDDMERARWWRGYQMAWTGEALPER